MRSERTRVLVEIALTVALSAVLSMLAVRLPINFAGGTISLSMVPILVLALRRGVFPGVIAGVLFGCVDYLIEPFFVAPIQVLLDYPIAFGAVGLAGLGSGALPPCAAPYRRCVASSGRFRSSSSAVSAVSRQRGYPASSSSARTPRRGNLCGSTRSSTTSATSCRRSRCASLSRRSCCPQSSSQSHRAPRPAGSSS